MPWLRTPCCFRTRSTAPRAPSSHRSRQADCRHVEQGAAKGGNAAIGARIRYQHAVRALERQATVLSELRSRASIILSAMGLTASVFGARALESDAPGWLKGVALVFLTLGLAACVIVLWPVHDRGPMPADPRNPGPRFRGGQERRWKVTPSARELEDATALGSEQAMLDAIVVSLTPARRVNYRTLEERSLIFVAAVVLLALQVVTWSVALLVN